MHVRCKTNNNILLFYPFVQDGKDPFVPCFAFVLCIVKSTVPFYIPLRSERSRGQWLEYKGTRHQWSGPEAKAGTRLRDRCLDGCYGNRRQARPFASVALTEASGENERGKQGDEGLRERKKKGGGGGGND